jgi:DNA processing protein
MSGASPAYDDPELAAWLRLAFTPGLGRSAARSLLASFGSPEAVWQASTVAWREVLRSRAAQAVSRDDLAWHVNLQRSLEWLSAGEHRGVITLGDPLYPPALLQTADPPLLLFRQGDPGCLRGRALAIVGSRRPTAQGLAHAREFAQVLAAHGLVIVSGLARGIDGAAHEGALQAGGRTVAVVGTGLDQVYPPGHRSLAERIGREGLLLSEFAPGTPPLGENFPMRNRIIAGLSLGVLVVEAALQSGSLITARLAVEAGRDVFAIPGSVQSAQSRGCHALIRQGALLVETPAEVLAELDGTTGPSAAGQAASRPVEDPSEEGEDDDPVLRALGYDPVSVDAICARCGWPVSEVSARLLEYELMGAVARLPGGLYQRQRLA